MAYYNLRVTGNPLELPYQVYEHQYAVASVFAWSAPRPEPLYHHAVLRAFWAGENVRDIQGAKAHLLSEFFIKLSTMYGFFFGLYPLLIPPLIWPYALKTPQERLGVLMLAGGLASLVPLTGFQYHYAAAIMPAVYLRFLQTIARLLAWRPAKAKLLGFVLAVFFLALIPCQFAGQVVKLWTDGEYAPRLAYVRKAVVRQLEAQPGMHLVLVRYAPGHNLNEDWVFNRADIDSSRIVWAHEMGPEQDLPFIQYFRARRVWLLEADQSPPRLSPYNPSLAAHR